jgi:hypothetical protein
LRSQVLTSLRSAAMCSFLERSGLDRNVKSIMHHSAQANAARNAAVMGREAEFLAFSKMLSMQEIVDVAAEIMQENSISVAMSAETIARLRKTTLSESRKKLAFIYSTCFAKLRAVQPRPVPDGARIIL